MERIRTLFVLLLAFFSLSLTAQNQDLKKADKLYKLKKYAEAMPFFKAGLEEKDNLSAKTKLAYCYRMTNRMDSAEALYSQIVTHERAKNKTYFFFGEALMSNSKYDEAKKWFLTYLEEKPDDEQALALVKACEEVKTIQPFYQKISIEPFPYNSDVDETAPVFFKDAIIFSSDRNTGMKLLKEKSGWTGRDYINLYISEKHRDSGYVAPKMYSKKFNELNKNTGMVSFTKAGTAAYFTRNGTVLTKSDAYSMQLYSAESTDGEKWKKVSLLPFCNPGKNYMHPAISPDGKKLFFISDKGGGEGGMDIFVSKKRKEGWGRPENLGPNVNTPGHEGFPYVVNDSTLFFCSKGHVGYGGFDIFYTTQNENGEWTKPVNIGKPINSSYDDISIFIEEEKQQGMFTSSRDGGDDDIYFFYIGDRAIETSIVTNKLSKDSIALKEETSITETPIVEKKDPKDLIETPIDEQTAIDLEETIKVTDIRDLSNKEEQVPEKVLTAISVETDTTKVKVVGLKPEPVSPSKAFDPLIKAIADNTVEVGNSFRINTIKYGKNVAALNPNIEKELNQLVAIMQQHTSLRIELSGHTASIGHDDKNLEISQQRVDAILNYLLEKGISKERMEAKGYGETVLLNNCTNDSLCSFNDHMKNQRLEVKILKY